MTDVIVIHNTMQDHRGPQFMVNYGKPMFTPFAPFHIRIKAKTSAHYVLVMVLFLTLSSGTPVAENLQLS